MSMMVSFVLSFFPRDVLDEILNLIESVSEDFPSYSYKLFKTQEITVLFSFLNLKKIVSTKLPLSFVHMLIFFFAKHYPGLL